MADELKCKCGAGPFEAVKDLRIHILTSARKDGKGIHGWPSAKEFPNPPSTLVAQTPVATDAPVNVEESARSAGVLQEFAKSIVLEDEEDPSDLALEMDEMRYMLRVMRSEFEAFKEKVEAPAAVWSDAVKPVPIDQEAVNLAQLDAMLGIDQPGPLDIKEEEILAAVESRMDEVNIEAPMADSETEPEKPKGVPRGVFLILAFVAVVGVVVLVITQM